MKDNDATDDRRLRLATDGKVDLDGRDITRLRANQRGLGIVFQSYALFPHMTVKQNVAFGLEMQVCSLLSEPSAWTKLSS